MNRYALAGTLIILFVAGLGIGLVSSASLGTSSTTAVSTTTVTKTSTITALTSSSSSPPYVLTLVITTNNIYNSTVGDQPTYYVLGPNGLESSSNISLPAHRLIKLVIVNYDDGAANLTSSQYANVSGTQNNVVTVVNNDNVNSSQGTSGIQVKGGETVSSVSPDNVAHTFTVPNLNLNIPVPPSSIVTAYITLNQTGTFTWFCMTICGSGADGTGGAMSTFGWMTGSMIVS
ncbi:MAG: cupredoxin domain-containing protein [Nitrososphaerales archaeon]